jgi:hypothetical protein
MDPLATWEKVVLGLFALALIWFVRPGLKSAFERSAAQENKDWKAIIVPLLLVVLFVLLLISMV